MATTKTAEEIEHLAYQDFTFDGKTLPPGQTTPHGYRKFFRAYKKGYDRASLQTSELIEAVEKVKNSLIKNIESAENENPAEENKKSYFNGYISNAENVVDLLDELLKAHKPTPQ